MANRITPSDENREQNAGSDPNEHRQDRRHLIEKLFATLHELDFSRELALAEIGHTPINPELTWSDLNLLVSDLIVRQAVKKCLLAPGQEDIIRLIANRDVDPVPILKLYDETAKRLGFDCFDDLQDLIDTGLELEGGQL